MDPYSWLLDDKITTQNLANIVLAGEGVKPVSWLHEVVRTTAPEEGGSRVQLATVFQQHNFCAISYLKGHEKAVLRHTIIGKSLPIAEAFKEVHLNRVMPVVSKWIIHGMLLGYPTTAVNGFVTQDQIYDIVLCEELLTQDEIDVYHTSLFFRLSRANWRSEVPVLRHWIETLKQASPSVYEHLLGVARYRFER